MELGCTKRNSCEVSCMDQPKINALPSTIPTNGLYDLLSARILANRITRVTTSRGDNGSTTLADGKVHPKHSGPIELVGVLDETNCDLGVLVQYVVGEHRNTLTEIQSRLFDIGAAVATGIPQPVWQEQVSIVTKATEELNEQLEPLQEFILPGGGKASACAHVARASVRRAERTFWKYASESLKSSGQGAYLNRVADYLFVLARTIAISEEQWQPLHSNSEKQP